MGVGPSGSLAAEPARLVSDVFGDPSGETVLAGNTQPERRSRRQQAFDERLGRELATLHRAAPEHHGLDRNNFYVSYYYLHCA